MAHTPKSTTVVTTPPQTDDFKQIRPGIGPTVEARLHRAGIHTFEQFAALSAEDIVAYISPMIGLTAERVTSWDWLGQARKLAQQKTATPRGGHHEASEDSQHYANFTVELLLDTSNMVRGTRVVHVQSGEKASWAGWEVRSLVDFFVQRGGLRLPEKASLPDETAGASEEEPAAGPAGEVRLKDLVALGPNTGQPRHTLPHGEPIYIRLILDTMDVVTPPDTPLIYAARVHARHLDSGAQHKLAEARGVISPPESPTIDVQGLPLDPGSYRLEAIVSLTTPAHEAKTRPPLEARLQGSLLNVC